MSNGIEYSVINQRSYNKAVRPSEQSWVLYGFRSYVRSYSNLMPFSALDRDLDLSTTHCAQFYEAGWWYKHCHHGNLNGRYTPGVVWYHAELDEWLELKRTIMMISRGPAPGSDRGVG